MQYRELALQQRTDDGGYLVFPSEFRADHPDMPDPDGVAVAFDFEGPIQNIYATLVVRRSHSHLFTNVGMWRNAAAFAPARGGLCGMFLSRDDEGSGSLTLFFEPDTVEYARHHFTQYVLRHLERHAGPQSVVRCRIVVCEACGERIPDTAIAQRTKRGDDDLPCPACDKRVSLLDDEERMRRLYGSRVAEMDAAAEETREEEARVSAAVGAMQGEEFRAWAHSVFGAAATEVTAAIVFTDLVDSTAFGQARGNREATVIRGNHLSWYTELVERHAGSVVNSKGDGIVAVFRVVEDAVNFAEEAYHDPGHEDLAARAGVHVGAVHLAGGAASGNSLAFCARFEAEVGDAGVCISNAARELLRVQGGSPPAGDRRPNRKLKGFPGVHDVWRLRLD